MSELNDEKLRFAHRPWCYELAEWPTTSELWNFAMEEMTEEYDRRLLMVHVYFISIYLPSAVKDAI